MRTRLAVMLFFPVVLACHKEKPIDAALSPSAKQAAPVGLPPIAAGAGEPAAAPEATAANDTLSGTVLERIDAPPYVYLRLDVGGGQQWAAVNQAEIKVGEKVNIDHAMPMDGFESKTLKRRFDKIVFGTLGGPAAAAAAAPAPAPSPAPGGAAPHGGSHTTVPAAPDVKVSKAEGPGAQTVAEVFANRTALKDQAVTVRGKVVKYNGGIMGKNWLHLQDGSGTEAKGDHDIAVTTTDEAKVGDVVTVRGAVHLDRDFGSGYAYTVIVEDAKLLQ